MSEKKSSSSKLFHGGRSFVIITGASRGFGRVLALQLANKFFSEKNDDFHLKIILIARNHQELKNLNEELLRLYSGKISCVSISADLSKHQDVIELEKKLISEHESEYENYVLIHNAGSLGNLSEQCRTITAKDGPYRDSYYRLNVLSVMELTGAFLRIIPSSSDAMVYIINISSLLAIKSITGLLDYGIGKSAREAFFRSLSEEVKQYEKSGNYRILNYAPGPLKTEMFDQLTGENSRCRECFKTVKPLEPDDSAKKMITILIEDQYQNGDHVDYFDI